MGNSYSAVFYAPDGNGKLTQRWRSTRQGDWRKAIKAALEMEENARKEVAESARDCLAVVERAAQLATQGLLSVTAAQNFVAELYSLSSGGESLARHSTAKAGSARPATATSRTCGRLFAPPSAKGISSEARPKTWSSFRRTIR